MSKRYISNRAVSSLAHNAQRSVVAIFHQRGVLRDFETESRIWIFGQLGAQNDVCGRIENFDEVQLVIGFE